MRVDFIIRLQGLISSSALAAYRIYEKPTRTEGSNVNVILPSRKKKDFRLMRSIC